MRITISINAKVGSKFQDKIITKGLGVALNSWEKFFNNTHKENKIEVRSIFFDRG